MNNKEEKIKSATISGKNGGFNNEWKQYDR